MLFFCCNAVRFLYANIQRAQKDITSVWRKWHVGVKDIRFQLFNLKKTCQTCEKFTEKWKKERASDILNSCRSVSSPKSTNFTLICSNSLYPDTNIQTTMTQTHLKKSEIEQCCWNHNRQQYSDKEKRISLTTDSNSKLTWVCRWVHTSVLFRKSQQSQTA